MQALSDNMPNILIHSSGMKVITTCSPKNFDLVKGIGADAVYDYVGSNQLYTKSRSDVSSAFLVSASKFVKQRMTPCHSSLIRSTQKRRQQFVQTHSVLKVGNLLMSLMLHAPDQT